MLNSGRQLKLIQLALFLTWTSLVSNQKKTLTFLWSNTPRELRRVLDIHAPDIERKITIRHKNPWFKPELRDQKRKVQQREHVWRKYHQQHQWEALKRERKVYRSMLTSIRTEVLSDKVKECNNNSGNSLTSKLKNLSPRHHLRRSWLINLQIIS